MMTCVYDKRALRRLMRANGVSPHELAEKSGMTWNNVRMLSAGVTVPKVNTLARLASALGVSISEFFTEAT